MPPDRHRGRGVGLHDRRAGAGRVTLSASLGTGLAATGSVLDVAIEEADRGVYVDKRRDGVIRRVARA